MIFYPAILPSYHPTILPSCHSDHCKYVHTIVEFADYAVEMNFAASEATKVEAFFQSLCYRLRRNL